MFLTEFVLRWPMIRLSEYFRRCLLNPKISAFSVSEDSKRKDSFVLLLFGPICSSRPAHLLLSVGPSSLPAPSRPRTEFIGRWKRRNGQFACIYHALQSWAGVLEAGCRDWVELDTARGFWCLLLCSFWLLLPGFGAELGLHQNLRFF